MSGARKARGAARFAPPFRMPVVRQDWRELAGRCLARLTMAPTRRTVMELWNDLGDVVASYQHAGQVAFFVAPTKPRDWIAWLAREIVS